MTIKELSEFTGKTDRTIRRWINKAENMSDVPYDTMSQGIPHNYSINEVEEILKAGSMSKDAVFILMQNAKQQLQNATQFKSMEPPVQNMEIVGMFKIMMEQQQEFMKNVLSIIGNVPRENKQLLLPEAPTIEPRLYLNQLVREYAELKGVEFRNAWNVLYTEILYRCNTNVKVKAKNEGLKPIAYLEKENMLLTACSIVKGLING